MVLKSAAWNKPRFRNGYGVGPPGRNRRLWVDPAFGGGLITGSCSLFWWIDNSADLRLPNNTQALYNPANFYALSWQPAVFPYVNLGLQSQGNYIALPDTAGRHFVEVRQDAVNLEFSVFYDGNTITSRATPGLQPFQIWDTAIGSEGFPWTAWLRSWPGAIPPASSIYQQQIAGDGNLACQNIVIPSTPQQMMISAGPGQFWEVSAAGVTFSPSIGMGTQTVQVTLAAPTYGTRIPVAVSSTAGKPRFGGCSILSTGVCPNYLTVPRAITVSGNLDYGSGSYAPTGQLTAIAGQPQWNMPAAPSSGSYYALGSVDCQDSGGYFGWSGDLTLYHDGVVAKSLALSVSATPGYLPLNYLPQGTWSMLASSGVTGNIVLT